MVCDPDHGKRVHNQRYPSDSRREEPHNNGKYMGQDQDSDPDDPLYAFYHRSEQRLFLPCPECICMDRVILHIIVSDRIYSR